jgi:cell division protein FtsN
MHLAVKITSRDFKRARPGGIRFDFGRWREFGVGLALGLCLSLFVLIWQNYRETQAASAAASVPRPEPRPDKATADPEEGAQNYDFYEKLQNFEVVIPEKDREVSNARNSAPVKIERPGVYVLQAGSYRQQEVADRTRAQLKLQGIDANVQRVAVDDDVWYRVRIGPLTELTEVNRLYARLRAADLDPLVLRVGE